MCVRVAFAQDVFVGNILSGSTNGTVSAVDPRSNTVLSIPVGVFPNSIAVSPQGDKAYVVNAGSNTVSVINTATKTVIATVPVCQSPLAAALNSVGTRLYVTCAQQDTGTGSLSVFDASSLSFLMTIPNIGYAALAIAITPDDEKAFIPLRDSGSVAVVDLITLAVRNITVGGLPGSGPFEIALSPSGSRAYIAIPSSSMAILDTNTELVLGRVGVRARGVAVTADGERLYVADSDTRTVSMVNLQDSTVEPINTGADGYANHLAIHVNGKVYVSKAKFDPNSPGTLLAIDAVNNLILSEVELEVNPFKVATMPRPFDLTPPMITVSATPQTLSPPNGRMVTVTISGRITDTESGVNASTTAYAVTDEYGLIQPSGGPITLGKDGSYAFTIPLQASRRGNDRDGRQYIITVSAQDMEGNMGSELTRVIVPHDRGG